MIIPSRHGVHPTLTSTGRVVHSWVPGPADKLHGPSRWLEVWARLRQAHSRCHAARILIAAWRHGVTLSGPAISRRR